MAQPRVMQRSRKLSRSGFRITELYSELESALIARDPERACCLTAELACSVGGQTKCVVSYLVDTYCARCVNSRRAQLNLLHTSLAHLGDGTSKSPQVNACLDAVFRRGLCILTLLVACGGQLDTTLSVGAAFARVPRSESVPSLEVAMEALRQSTSARDARSMSAVIKAVPDELWFAKPSGSSGCRKGMLDVQRLRAVARRDPVWDMWSLALDLGKDVGVSEYVENSLHAFAWGYSATTKKTRIYLLWYAFLVIIKGAPRAGPHPIDTQTLETALHSIDRVFDDILSGQSLDLRADEVPPQVTTPPPTSTPKLKVAVADVDSRLNYLLTVPRIDASKAWEVEKDREAARSLWMDTESHMKCIHVKVGKRESVTDTQAALGRSPTLR